MGAPIDEKKEFISLRAKGYSFRKIAKILDKHTQTLVNWSKEFEFDIEHVKNVEIETLYEEVELIKRVQAETYIELIKRLKVEIAERDFSNIPTDKLIELFMKLNTAITLDQFRPRFKTSEDLESLKTI